MAGEGGQVAVALANGATLMIQDVAAVPAPAVDAPPGEDVWGGAPLVNLRA
jgi:hypothetical protein